MGHLFPADSHFQAPIFANISLPQAAGFLFSQHSPFNPASFSYPSRPPFSCFPALFTCQTPSSPKFPASSLEASSPNKPKDAAWGIIYGIPERRKDFKCLCSSLLNLWEGTDRTLEKANQPEASVFKGSGVSYKGMLSGSVSKCLL